MQNPFNEIGSFSNTQTPQIQPTVAFSLVESLPSAKKYQPPHVGLLVKRTFKKFEKVNITVANQQSSDMDIVLLDPEGKKVNQNVIQKITLGNETAVTLDPTQFQFFPGKYTLNITDSSGKTTTQDFTWGVLALNTNKSLYTPSSIADLSIAVLDDKGVTVCNAEVNLDIKSPSGVVTHLTTEDNSIVVNNQCSSHDMSVIADYEAHFPLTSKGDYEVTLTASTPNGTNSINDNMHVAESVDFDVERVSATRLYPENTYPMIFHVVANQDFSGNIAETVPANFQITPISQQNISSFDNIKIVIPTVYMMDTYGVASLNLGVPFTGKHNMIQGFGAILTDPEEAPYYNSYGLAGHDGLDFAMNSGVPILATDDGNVVLSGDGAYGTMVVMSHAWGKSYYGHLSKVEVQVGEHIKKGEEIGLSGESGHASGPHLHFGIKPLHADLLNGFYGKVDPTPFLDLPVNNSDSSISGGNMGYAQRIITWNVKLKKGDSLDLGYNYKSPLQSPAFYNLGPLKFIDNGDNIVFQEERQWQIAVDANSTAGPNNCSSSANDTADTGAGTVSWGTVGSNNGACANAGTTAAANITSTTTSHFLKITGFGFSIPASSRIVGVQFSIKRSGTSNQGGSTLDSHVYLINASTTQTSGTDQALGTAWPGAATAQSYGSAASISWGGVWTAADINNSGFGVAIGAKGSNTKTQTATVTGFVTATITYDQPPNTPISQSPADSSTTSRNIVDLQMTSTDTESDNVQYLINLYSGGSCVGSPTVYDQGTSQTNWIGSTTTCSVTGDCYTSGTQGDLNLSLSINTLYSWTAAARDPAGSNVLSSATACISFTSGLPNLNTLLRHGEWFNSGVIQPFTF